MVAGNMGNVLSQEHDQKKGSPPLKGCRKAWVRHRLDEINIICRHMKYEVVDENWRKSD